MKAQTSEGQRTQVKGDLDFGSAADNIEKQLLTPVMNSKKPIQDHDLPQRNLDQRRQSFLALPNKLQQMEADDMELASQASKRSQDKRDDLAGVVLPDKKIIYEARSHDLSLLDHYRAHDTSTGWDTIANNFVIHKGSKKRVSFFIHSVHEAKMRTERKMRFELDAKIEVIKLEKLNQALGKTLAERVRFYSKKYREQFDKSYTSPKKNINFDIISETPVTERNNMNTVTPPLTATWMPGADTSETPLLALTRKSRMSMAP